MCDGGELPVLHILNGEQYSGLERVVDHLVHAAPTFGYRIHLGLLKPGVMAGRMSSGRAIQHPLGMRHRCDLSVVKRATALAVERRCRIIHSHTVRGALVAVRVRRGANLPWVHHLHSPAMHESTHMARNFANFVAEKALVRRADCVIAVSESLADYATRYYGVRRSQISIVPNGVETAHVTIPMRAEAGRATVSAVGLFRPRKGIEVLVKAVSQLMRNGHSFRLRLVGEFADANYEKRIRKLVRDLGITGIVDFVGFAGDVGSELARCDVFVFPSLFGEGMPMAVLEAMAAGRPVVAFDIAGVRELLEGGAGVLVRFGQVGALAEAIGRLLSCPDLAASIGERGRERQVKQFGVAAMCSSVFSIYGSLGAQ